MWRPLRDSDSDTQRHSDTVSEGKPAAHSGQSEPTLGPSGLSPQGVVSIHLLPPFTLSEACFDSSQMTHVAFSLLSLAPQMLLEHGHTQRCWGASVIGMEGRKKREGERKKGQVGFPWREMGQVQGHATCGQCLQHQGEPGHQGGCLGAEPHPTLACFFGCTSNVAQNPGHFAPISGAQALVGSVQPMHAIHREREDRRE